MLTFCLKCADFLFQVCVSSGPPYLKAGLVNGDAACIEIMQVIIFLIRRSRHSITYIFPRVNLWHQEGRELPISLQNFSSYTHS